MRPPMPASAVFILYSHIFVQSALTVGGIQLPNRGLHNVSVLQMQLARTDGLPEPLASLRLILDSLFKRS